MAVNWDLYNTRLNINGITKRERDLISLQNKITNDLPNSLSCKMVKINGIDCSLNFTETKKGYDIQSLPNETFSVGDYVVYKTITYLINKVNGDDEIYTTGSMEECNHTLKFQSPDGTILSYPCIDESSSGGVSENEVITVLDGTKRIKLPFDDNTKLIREDRRFFVDKFGTTTYKVTNVNNTEFNYGNKGLIVLTMKTDSAYSQQTDKNGVCNYFEPIIEPEPPVEGYNYAVISISGNLIIGGNTRTITPTFYNANGTLSTETITPVWTVVLPNGFESDFTFTYVGNQIKIKVKDNYDLIDKNIVISVHGNNGGYGGTQTFLITTE